MKKRIGLGGKEHNFLLRLLDYVNKQGEVEAFYYSEEEGLKESFSDKKLTVLFVTEGFDVEVPASIMKVAFIKDRKSKNGIYQYQSAAQLYREMCHYIWKDSVQKPVWEGEKKMYAVYSPVGRSGKTSFACAYAKKNSFFYLGLEEYGIKTNDFCSEGEILYHIKNRKQDVAELFINHAEYVEGLLLFGSPVRYTDIRWLNSSDFQWLIEMFRGSDSIPPVMVDFGSGCISDLEILDYFDRIYLPVINGDLESRKMMQFKEMLYEINGRMEDKIEEILVPSMSWKHPEFLDQVQYMRGLTYE